MKEEKEQKKVLEENTIEDSPTSEENIVKQPKKSNEPFIIIACAILIIALIAGVFVLGSKFADKENNKKNEETKEDVKKETYDKNKYKNTSYLYMDEKGEYCGNKGINCEKEGLAIPSETKEIDVLSYQPNTPRTEPRFVLYKENSAFRLYDAKNKTIDEIKLKEGFSYYYLHVNDDETEVIGIILNSDNGDEYYNLKKDKSMYVGKYANIMAESEEYLSATNITGDNYEGEYESYLLNTNEEKIEMKTTGECKYLSVKKFKDKIYYLENDGCIGSSITTIYSNSKIAIAKNKEATDWSTDSEGNLYVLNNNKVEKYNADGKLLETSKTYSNVLHLIKEFVVYKEGKTIYITDGKEVTKVGELKEDLDYHSMLSGYYNKYELSNENEKEAGIYLIFGEVDGSGVEFYFNPKTKEVKKFDLEYIGGYAKPVLYLYPEKTTEVTVNFEHEDKLTTTYPKFKDEWKVTAHPNGDLYDKDGKYYYGLYWEEDSNHKVDFSEGFYVSKDNAIQFLEEKLSTIGLNAKERNEFIMYWLPILEKNEHNLVYFELTEERDSFNKLDITPAPDSLLRVAIHVKKVSGPQTIKKQKLDTFKRNGFVAVEWGGVVYK